MRELTWIVQTSLDGFVAGPNGEFDNFLGGEENLEFVCGVIVMGWNVARHSFASDFARRFNLCTKQAVLLIRYEATGST